MTAWAAARRKKVHVQRVEGQYIIACKPAERWVFIPGVDVVARPWRSW